MKKPMGLSSRKCGRAQRPGALARFAGKGIASPAALLLCAALPLAACGVGDDYKRPDVAVPLSWSQPVESGGEAVDSTWWRRFGSPALDGYIAAANTGNLDVRAAVARVRQADAQARITGAALLPALDLDAGVTRKHTPDLSSNHSSSSKASQTTTYSTSLSASYEIDFWGKNRYARESAEALATADRFDRRTILLTAQSSVADTDFTILGARDRLDVAKRTLANARDVLDAIRDRETHGTATSLDVAQQESTVAADEAAIPPLEQTLEQNVDALAVLIGQPPEAVKVETGTLDGLSLPRVAPGLPSELLERRPDVQYAEYELISANADLNEARAELFPSVSLTAEYGFESLALSSLFNQGNALWSLASSVTQPIFHGGALEGGVNLKEGRLEELVADYQKAVISAFSDVEDALVAVRRSTEQEAAQGKAVETSRRAYDLSLDQFRAGTTDIVTLLNTQKTLFSAEDNLVQARLAHFQAIVSLFKALGGGWDGTADSAGGGTTQKSGT